MDTSAAVAANFSPLQRPTVTAEPPVSAFSATDHFYNAIFPIAQAGERQHTTKVTMTSTGDVPGETDKTTASGQVTISYGACPASLQRCP